MLGNDCCWTSRHCYSSRIPRSPLPVRHGTHRQCGEGRCCCFHGNRVRCMSIPQDPTLGAASLTDVTCIISSISWYCMRRTLVLVSVCKELECICLEIACLGPCLLELGYMRFSLCQHTLHAVLQLPLLLFGSFSGKCSRV